MLSGDCPCTGDNNNCGNWLDNFVSYLYDNIAVTAGQSLSFVSGWVLSSVSLGKLNDLIDTYHQVVCFTGESGDITGYTISGCMCPPVQGIYAKLYEYEFYNSQARYALSGIGGSSVSFTTIKDYNKTYTRESKVAIARMFRDMAKEAKEDLDKLVKYYLKYNALPQVICGYDVYASFGYDQGWGYFGFPNNTNYYDRVVNYPAGS